MAALSTDQPGVLVVTISFKYNFLAEGVVNCLQSDPGFSWPVMVINVAKSLDHAALFKVRGEVKNVFFGSGWSHSSTLNALTLSSNFYAQTRGYDWLLMIDHDVFFTEQGFQRDVERIMAELIRPGEEGEPLLIAPISGFEGKIFNTNPIMLLNVKEEARRRWSQCKQTWDVKPNWTCDGDTGQLLGHELDGAGLVKRFRTVDELPGNIHIGSAWYTDNPASHPRSINMLIQARREGLICPSPEDIELMTRDKINPVIIDALRIRQFSSL